MSAGSSLQVAMLATSISQVAQGYGAYASSQAQASAMQVQGEIAQFEADREAARIQKEGDRFRKKQKLAFIKSGLTLEGSPLLVLEETRYEVEREASAERLRGKALGLKARHSAENLRAGGRAKFISGIIGGASSYTTSYIQGKAAGVF